jgi:MFS family permease
MSDAAAAAVGSLTLLLTVVSRPLGGWILRTHPGYTRRAVGASLAAGGLGTLLLIIAQPAPLAILGAALVGVGAGISFSPTITGAAMSRPDAPAAAMGLVNGFANSAILIGTPLVGLTFGMAGGGRIGFAVIAGLWLIAIALLPHPRMLGVDADRA